MVENNVTNQYKLENKIFAVHENWRKVESRWFGLCFL